MSEIILKEENGQVLASSREVAEKFDKNHKEVLRAIKNISKEISTAQFCALFKLSSYKASNGKQNPEYLMNRDGFSLLSMGFTGKEALEWKLKYINAFNQMEEKLKSSTQLTVEEKYKLMLFSKDASEVAYAHNKLVEIATAPLVAEIKEQKPKVEYHDDVLNKEGLITTTVIAKDLGFKSATKLNKIMNMNKIIFKNQSGTWCPYADYEWLISDGYADYQSYTQEHSSPCLKWTEKGRKWIIENYNNWVMKLVS
jgi:Rha family phage regulatory protein